MATEQDTFDKLRRVSYYDACAAYITACISNGLPSNATSEDMDSAAKEPLQALGWTIESLSAEHMRMRNR